MEAIQELLIVIICMGVLVFIITALLAVFSFKAVSSFIVDKTMEFSREIERLVVRLSDVKQSVEKLDDKMWELETVIHHATEDKPKKG